MQSSLEKLRKFFRLEHGNGYANSAVIGGLAKILDYWEGEARNEAVPEPLIQAVESTLRLYADQTPEVRRLELLSLWKEIQAEYPEAAPQKKPTAPAGPVEPVAAPSEPLPAPSQTGQLEAASSPSLAPPPSKPLPPPPLTPSSDSPAFLTTVLAPLFPSRLPPASDSPAPISSSPFPPPAHTLAADSPVPLSPSPRPAHPVPGRADARPGGITSKRPIALNASLTVLAGVGPRHASMLTRLGLNTLGDMLYNFPRRYEDYSQLKPIRDVFYGQQVTVIGEVTMLNSRPLRGGKMTITEAVINDGTAGLRLSWFNQPWLANRLKVGDAISVSGKVEQYLGRLVMNSPDWEPVEVENLHTNRIVPIYPLTANVTQKWLRKLMHQVVTYWAPRLTDHLPETIRNAAGLPDLGTALLQAHFPDSDEKLQAARQRLAFDEIFFLQTGVLRQRRDWQSVPGRIFAVEDAWLDSRLAALPFALTDAQKQALVEIRLDLHSGKPMNRLLQGDVGSGKTIVAALASAIVNFAGAQAAIMAPTSILAEQHYRTFLKILASENGLIQPASIRLLVGDTPAAEKDEIRLGLADGSILIVIGTHALLEDPVDL